MRTSTFISHIEKLFDKCVSVAKAKNADYSASDSNAFRNFEAVELFGIAETKQGIAVRLTDKFTRIANLLNRQGPPAVNESLADSIEDAINYLAILHARLTYEQTRSDSEEPIRKDNK